MIQANLSKCHMFSILMNHCRLLPAKYYQVFQIPRYLILKTYSNSVDQINKIVPILRDKNIYIKKRAKIFQEIENIVP